jgi:hypothetical protein
MSEDAVRAALGKTCSKIATHQYLKELEEEGGKRAAAFADTRPPLQPQSRGGQTV